MSWRLAAAACGALATCACTPQPEGPPRSTTRLAEVFDAKGVSGTPPATAASAPTEWRFSQGPAGFEAGPGVSGFAAKDGALVGKSTTDVPILHVERTLGLDNPDQLYAVEVRARVSSGANLYVLTRGGPKVDLGGEASEARGTPWTLKTPLVAGDAMQTYTIPISYALVGSRVRHVLLRPTDTAGASFAIESMRLVFRKEHLAAVPSGVSWQGLRNVFHETLVTRAPEVARVNVRVPQKAVLDLALGTPEDGPVTFVVSAARGSATPAPLLEHTVTTPHRWEARRVDLSAYAGQELTLSLAARADAPGRIAFWGSAAVRARDTAPAKTPRGVILIQADTLRPDHLDLFGYGRQTAPTLTRMAGQGVLFRNALAQTAWTKASTTSMMTSLYPSTHGVHQIPDRIPAATPTLAESFRQRGYATLSFSSVPFTGRLTNLHMGFDEVHESESHSAVGTPLSSKTAREYVDRLAGWLEAHRDVPFFVYLHVFDPHSPYEPLPPWNTLFADPSRREEFLRQQETLKKFIQTSFLAQRGMATREEVVKAGLDPEAYIRQCQDWYDGSIRGMDAELGRLVERLKALGLDERTLVALYADHGEEFHDHGRMWHGQSVYGEMIRVPLLMWGAGAGKGVVRDETVQLIDVMPTLLEASGIEIPATAQGHSLTPLLAPGKSGWTQHPAIAEKQPMGGTEYPSAAVSYAIVDGDWKLVRNVARPEGKPEFELFDFRGDRLDQKNVAGEHPDVVAKLAKALDSWKKQADAAKLKPDSEATQGMSAERLEQLRALGYIQ
jgi:arylsulfatase A-like enzyme